MTADEFSSMVHKSDLGKGGLISLLEEIQARHSYLPEEALRSVAKQTGLSLVDIYGVATFFRAFSLKPRGRHLVSVCLGTACHVRGGPAIAEKLEDELGIRAGQTTSDNEFTLERVNCLGACALGPVVVVDGHYFPHVGASAVKAILERARTGLDKIETAVDQRLFPLEVSCARCNHSLMDPRHVIDGYPPVRVTVSFGDKHGRLLLSSVYGSYEVQSEDEIPMDTVVHMFCPHCHAELIGGSACGECAAPMVPMIVRGGGVVQICSRRGCTGHMLDLGGTPVY
ncbi:MAG TPA: NAD(P)H-dependent oxidoreductase subunit E [Candidatus Deferrimicrobium sp.]|nr:NAD(P)H-dependent oxidoreductase subunit E [Candidatus Deferrimicrobium sp.]